MMVRLTQQDMGFNEAALASLIKTSRSDTLLSVQTPWHVGTTGAALPLCASPEWLGRAKYRAQRERRN
jgi:hypothetical protein